MFNRSHYFALLFALLSPVLLSADTVVEEIIARVNNQIITRSQYQHEQEQLKTEAAQQDAAHADKIVEQGQQDVLRGLIDRQLLIEKGKELGIATPYNDAVVEIDRQINTGVITMDPSNFERLKERIGAA